MSGKRAGSRRAAAPAAGPRWLPLIGLTLAMTLALVAWGYLVIAAVDFGASARSGESGSWWFLALAALGAAACLFAGLLLAARVVRVLRSPPPPPSGGGRRASR